MNNISTQQEVLLMTGTSFATRQYNERENNDNSNSFSGRDKLIDACWNGLLKEMLPEIYMLNSSAAKLYLWHLWESNHFFMLEMGDFPTDFDDYFTINPYRFINTQGYN